MPRHLNLRQIEAFKAVIENGTVSRGAEVVNISQPAMSKLITHLEADTELRLFDRIKGRLAPTEHAMRLYGEIERIFAGVRQVENAVDAIRREEQGRLAVGVMPALSGLFIQSAITRFLSDRRSVFCSVQSLSSERTVDWVIDRKLDVGLVSALIDNPYVTVEPLLERDLVCVMPLDHPLVEKTAIEPEDLHQTPFVAFHPDTFIGHRIEQVFQQYGVAPQTVLVANAAPLVCEFVAAGLGVALVHPLFSIATPQRMAVRRFIPDIPFGFQICRSKDSRNAHLVEAFVQELRGTSDHFANAMDRHGGSPARRKKRR